MIWAFQAQLSNHLKSADAKDWKDDVQKMLTTIIEGTMATHSQRAQSVKTFFLLHRDGQRFVLLTWTVLNWEVDRRTHFLVVWLTSSHTHFTKIVLNFITPCTISCHTRILVAIELERKFDGYIIREFWLIQKMSLPDFKSKYQTPISIPYP